MKSPFGNMSNILKQAQAMQEQRRRAATLQSPPPGALPA